MKRIGFVGALLASTVGLALLPGVADADRRIFGFTYPYMTLPEGAKEIEYYLDVGLLPEASVAPELNPDLTDLRPAFQHQIEFEYAITDHLDFGFFNVLQQDVLQQDMGTPLQYRGVKLRSRYRFREEGDLPVDLGVYGEFAYFGDEYQLEERLIVAKTVRQIEIDFNLRLEQEFKREVEVDETGPVPTAEVVTNFSFGLVPSLGFGYHVSQSFAFGLELAPEIEFADETTFTSALGPTVSFTGNGFWWTVAAQYRVHSEDDPEGQTYKDGDVLIRSLFALIL